MRLCRGDPQQAFRCAVLLCAKEPTQKRASLARSRLSGADPARRLPASLSPLTSGPGQFLNPLKASGPSVIAKGGDLGDYFLAQLLRHPTYFCTEISIFFFRPGFKSYRLAYRLYEAGDEPIIPSTSPN